MEDARQSLSRECAHQRMVGNRFGTVLPVSTYVKHSPTCLECSLLLQVVEELKPGWVDQEKNHQGLIHVTIRPVYAVQLLRALPHWTKDSYDRDTELVGEFHYLRRSKGAYESTYGGRLHWQAIHFGNLANLVQQRSLFTKYQPTDTVKEQVYVTKVPSRSRWYLTPPRQPHLSEHPIGSRTA